jgi:hypothetical protein
LLDKKKVAWGWVSFCARRKKPEASHSALAASKAPTKPASVGQSSARRGQAGGRSAARRPLAGLPKTQKGHNTRVERQFPSTMLPTSDTNLLPYLLKKMQQK